MEGTVVHEIAHAYEYKNFGESGGNKIFSELDKYPTKYADSDHSECITTVCEQVSTKKLRHDAIMKDGTLATDYEAWAKEWSDLVREANKIIYG